MISTEPLFTLAKLAQSFKAIGDETRLRMIGLLTTGELCVCDFMAVLELPQSTASRHLAYLKNSGWVTGRRSGNGCITNSIPILPKTIHTRSLHKKSQHVKN